MITKEDKIIIKNSWESKKYGTRRLINKFPNKNWSRRGLEDFLRRLWATGSIERAPDSGRPRTVLTAKTVDAVEELAQSQEDWPQSHLSTRQISRELGISGRTASRIVHDDLLLKCLKLTPANQADRLQCAGQLLQRFSDSDVDFIWFIDENLLLIPHQIRRTTVFAWPTRENEEYLSEMTVVHTRNV